MVCLNPKHEYVLNLTHAMPLVKLYQVDMEDLSTWALSAETFNIAAMLETQSIHASRLVRFIELNSFEFQELYHLMKTVLAVPISIAVCECRFHSWTNKVLRSSMSRGLSHKVVSLDTTLWLKPLNVWPAVGRRCSNHACRVRWKSIILVLGDAIWRLLYEIVWWPGLRPGRQ